MRIELDAEFALNLERTGDGPPLVLLHGFTGSARSWGSFLNALAAHYTVIAVDIVGHGESDSPARLEHYRMAAAAEDVVNAVKRAGYPRAHWLGYSMGGRLALHVAAAHPEAVARLLLIGASPGLATEAERAGRCASDEALALRIEAEGVEPFIDYWQNIPLFASQRALPAERQAAIRNGRLANSAVGLANSLRGMGTGAQEPLFDALPALTMPALLLSGDADQKFTAIAAEMHADLPKARRVIISGAGHAAQTDQPERCSAAILQFLETPIRSGQERSTRIGIYA